MRNSNGRIAAPPPLVAIHHRNDDRAWILSAALSAAGFAVALLPPLNRAAPAWHDGGFDLLAFDPFCGPDPPRAQVRLARGIAARRPLIILSDRDHVAERLMAFEAGADDAVGWTDDPAEVVARVARLLRRNGSGLGRLDCDELRIDLIDRRVERAGQLIHLPLREFDLLANLARVPDRPVSRAALLKAVWRIDFDPGTNRVAVHMSRLRGRVDRGFAWPMLHTVKGHGYALVSRRGKLA